MTKRTLRLLKKADAAAVKTIKLADALRLEAQNLGKVRFVGGVGVWIPTVQQ